MGLLETNPKASREMKAYFRRIENYDETNYGDSLGELVKQWGDTDADAGRLMSSDRIDLLIKKLCRAAGMKGK